jgi:hypothetical protein
MIDQLRSTIACINQSVVALGIAATVGVVSAEAKGKPTPPPAPVPPVRYDITWFNTSGQYDDLSIYNVNNLGTTAVGSIRTSSGNQAVSIDLMTGVVSDLNSLTGIPSSWQLTSARGITDASRVAGEAINNLGNRVLFAYDPGDSTPFQPISAGLPLIRYRDMNNQGDVLYAQSDSTIVRNYLYTHDDEQSHQLPSSLWTAGGLIPSAGPQTVNDNRIIAGNRDQGLTSAYVYNYSTNATTNIPASFRSVEINNQSVVAGRGSLSSRGNPTQTAMKYAGGVKTPLVSNRDSEAFDINDVGQIVGRLYDSNPDTGFLFDPTSGFWSLNDLLQDNAQDTAIWYSTDNNPNDSFFQDIEVEAMSEPLVAGYPLIAGNKLLPASTFPDGVQRRLGFILTPISGATATSLVAVSAPEPVSLYMIATGLLPLLTKRSRRCLD